MNDTAIVIRPRDPLFFRDGRPFTADICALAESLPWPFPSTIAGAIRTYIGSERNYSWTPAEAESVLNISVHGPLALASMDGENWKSYFPAPADALCYRDDNGAIHTIRLSPWDKLPDGAGCNMPTGTDVTPLRVPSGEKPCGGMEWWSQDDMVKWLCGENIEFPQDTLSRLPVETRTHVRILPETGTHETGKLFSTLSLCFNDVSSTPAMGCNKYPLIAMMSRVFTELTSSSFENTSLILGGERRFSHMEEASAYGGWPSLPCSLALALHGQKRLKLHLVSPALFDYGWQPDWLATGAIPGLPQVKVSQLVSAAVARRTPVSGWNMTTTSRHKKTGPKAARFMVPMGSVYYLELEHALSAEDIEQLWLHPISDDEQDCRDGFGLAIPGVWNYASEGDDK